MSLSRRARQRPSGLRCAWTGSAWRWVASQSWVCARDEILLGLRSTPVGKYVLFYRLRGEVVEVLRILHGRRDLGRILKEGA